MYFQFELSRQLKNMAAFNNDWFRITEFNLFYICEIMRATLQTYEKNSLILLKIYCSFFWWRITHCIMRLVPAFLSFLVNGHFAFSPIIFLRDILFNRSATQRFSIRGFWHGKEKTLGQRYVFMVRRYVCSISNTVG